MNRAAGQLIDEPTFHCAGRKLPSLRPRSGARNMIEQPFQFRRGKIRIEKQSRPRAALRFLSRVLQFPAALRRAPVLPDDGVVQWPARLSVPENRRLALIGDAESCNLCRRNAFGCSPAAPDRCLPYLFGIVLDPAVGGINLS